MAFEIIRDDIMCVDTDAVVNASAGINGVLVEPGQAALQNSSNSNSRRTIFTILPEFDCNRTEWSLKTLGSCYENCLETAFENGITSVAFPFPGAVDKGFPKEAALRTAVNVFSAFLMAHDIDIYLVISGKNTFLLPDSLSGSVRSYISDNFTPDIGVVDENIGFSYEQCNTEKLCDAADSLKGNLAESLRMSENENTFSEELMNIIEERNLKPSQVYRKANIDRKHFSKIKNDPFYQPGKITAVAFALALELDMNETLEFIGRAGYTFTNSSRFDIIIEYCINHKIYDVFQVNEILFDFNQELIGYK